MVEILTIINDATAACIVAINLRIIIMTMGEI